MEENQTSATERTNPELQDLYTQAAGAIDLHETRTTEQAVEIGPPVSPNPGPYDVREGKYRNQFHTPKK